MMLLHNNTVEVWCDANSATRMHYFQTQ